MASVTGAARRGRRRSAFDAVPGAGGLAAVVETDPLLRLHVVAAARELGFAPTDGGAGSAALGRRPPPCSSASTRSRRAHAAAPVARGPTAAAAPLVVGYATGGPELLAAHRLHACCDVFLELRAVAGRACFVYLPAGGVVEQARLTTREADVLVLVLGGLSNAALAERLCVSPATARTHCRALLRKFGAADRRALRARLLGDSREVRPCPRREVCQGIGGSRTRPPHTYLSA